MAVLKEIYAKLDMLTAKAYKDKFTRLQEEQLIEFSMYVEDKDILDYYQELVGLPLDNITMILTYNDNRFKMSYQHHGRTLDPIIPYSCGVGVMLPTVFETIKECILQDTNRPDIRKLYRCPEGVFSDENLSKFKGEAVHPEGPTEGWAVDQAAIRNIDESVR